MKLRINSIKTKFTDSHHLHANLLKSSIKQVVCVGVWVSCVSFSHSHSLSVLSVCSLLWFSLLASSYSVPPPGCVIAYDPGSYLHVLSTAAAPFCCVRSYRSPFLPIFFLSCDGSIDCVEPTPAPHLDLRSMVSTWLPNRCTISSMLSVVGRCLFQQFFALTASRSNDSIVDWRGPLTP